MSISESAVLPAFNHCDLHFPCQSLSQTMKAQAEPCTCFCAAVTHGVAPVACPHSKPTSCAPVAHAQARAIAQAAGLLGPARPWELRLQLLLLQPPAPSKAAAWTPGGAGRAPWGRSPAVAHSQLQPGSPVSPSVAAAPDKREMGSASGKPLHSIESGPCLCPGKGQALEYATPQGAERAGFKCKCANLSRTAMQGTTTASAIHSARAHNEDSSGTCGSPLTAACTPGQPPAAAMQSLLGPHPLRLQAAGFRLSGARLLPSRLVPLRRPAWDGWPSRHLHCWDLRTGTAKGCR
jgi:hypothetical protein